jgi:hypothetical protein
MGFYRTRQRAAKPGEISSHDHLATAKLDAYYRSEDYRSPGVPQDPHPYPFNLPMRPDMTNVSLLIPTYSPNTLVPYFCKKVTYTSRSLNG